MALLNSGNFTVSVQAAAAKTAVSAAALAITLQPANANVNDGQAASFTVAASDAGAMSYQWRRNGGDIPGATAARYATAPLSFADNGALYSVVVRNASGNLTRAPATVAVSTGPLAPGISAELVSVTASSLGSAPPPTPMVSCFARRYQ